MENEKFELLSFTISSIIYKSDDSNFYIFVGRKVVFENPEDDKQPGNYVFKANFVSPNVSVGDTYRGTCEWVYDKRYGYQIRVDAPVIIYPSNENGIRRFLVHNIRGMGKHTASLIISEYHAKTLDVIRNEGVPALVKIKGIGTKKAELIVREVKKHENLETLSVYLFSHGITNYGEVLKIYSELGESSLERIRANPYCLCDYISLERFPTSDRIAISSGFEPDNILRVEKAVLYYIYETAFLRGDMYVLKNEIVNNIHAFLIRRSLSDFNFSEELYKTVLRNLEEKRQIVTDTFSGEPAVYLSRLYRVESGTAEIVRKMCQEERLSVSCHAFFTAYTEKTGTTPDKNQEQAVKNALSCRFSIVTGGPGTGKTQTVNAIISAIRHENSRAKIVLCAPTGKASKRLSELTGMQAETVHRLLNIKKEKELWSDAEETELEADYVICDEGSMINALLFYKLLSAVDAAGASFVLVGDKNQLLPVGCGCPLKELVESPVVPTVTLTTLFRQAAESQIYENASKILRGVDGVNDCLSFDVDKQDFFFFPSASRDVTYRYITRTIDSLVNLGTKPEDIMVLSSMQKTEYGVIALNKLVQSHLNPASFSKREYSGYVYTLREGDRVIQNVNNYSLGVFNGEIGVIESIDEEEKTITVVYDDYVSEPDEKTGVPTIRTIEKSVEYAFEDASELLLAYSITVHKAEGSEFPCVIMPISDMLINATKSILYTGVTRAKKRFVFVGDTSALYHALQKEEYSVRRSLLKDRLVH